MDTRDQMGDVDSSGIGEEDISALDPGNKEQPPTAPWTIRCRVVPTTELEEMLVAAGVDIALKDPDVFKRFGTIE